MYQGARFIAALQNQYPFIIERKRTRIDIVKEMLQKSMEQGYQLAVPLVVHISEGDTW